MTDIDKLERMYRASLRPCTTCGKPSRIRIRILVQVAEVMKRAPEILAGAFPDGKVASIPTKYGPMVCVGEAFACERCQKDAERAAAKHPDWCMAEISCGPRLDRVAVQVPS